MFTRRLRCLCTYLYEEVCLQITKWSLISAVLGEVESAANRFALVEHPQDADCYWFGIFWAGGTGLVMWLTDDFSICGCTWQTFPLLP